MPGKLKVSDYQTKLKKFPFTSALQHFDVGGLSYKENSVNEFIKSLGLTFNTDFTTMLYESKSPYHPNEILIFFQQESDRHLFKLLYNPGKYLKYKN